MAPTQLESLPAKNVRKVENAASPDASVTSTVAVVDAVVVDDWEL